jgi:HK97 family phage portal protein
MKNAFDIFGLFRSKAPVVKQGPNNPNWLLERPSQMGLQSSYLKDPYKDNIWVYSAIKALATNMSSVPFCFYSKDEWGGKKDKLKGTKFTKILSNPNEYMDFSLLLKFTVTFQEAYGSVFWILSSDRYTMEPIKDPYDEPEAIYVIDPRCVKAVTTNGVHTGWNIANGSASKFYHTWQLVRFYDVSTDGILHSMPACYPARQSIQMDMQAREFNLNYFLYGADIGGVLKYTGEEVYTEPQLREYQTLFDSRYAGASNRGKTPILANGFSYEPIRVSQKDMDYVNTLKMSREEIVAAYGVPKHILSLYEDTNYATAQVADRAFWMNSILPRMTQIANTLNRVVFKLEPFLLSFDFTKVEALKADLSAKLVNARKLYDLGYPVNWVNEHLNLGMPVIEEEWASEPVDARLFVQGITQSNDGGDKEDDTSDDKDKDKEKKSVVKSTYHETYERRVMGPDAVPFAKRITSYLIELRNEVIRNVDSLSKSVNKADYKLFDKKKWDKKIMDKAEPYIKSTASRALKHLSVEIGGFGSFSPSSSEVADAIKRTTVRITDTNDTIETKLRTSLGEGIKNGETEAELKERVRDVFKVEFTRVNDIVRTEQGMSASSVRMEAIKQEGLKKVWSTSADDEVREDHIAFGATGPMDVDEEYTSGLKFPQDPDCSDASQIVNCRCILTTKREGDTEDE